MTTLFFLLLIIPLFSEINDVLNPNRRNENLKKIKDYNTKTKEVKAMSGVGTLEEIRAKQTAQKEVKESLSSIMGTIIAYITYIVVLILGMLMSSQWILFLILFLIGLIVAVVKKISKNVIYQNTLTVVDSTICAGILLYIMINHFHHLDLIPLDLKGFIGMFI